MTFQHKTIWITGASSGIGEALAIEWSKYKPNIILSGRNIDKMEHVKGECEKNGAKCIIVQLDLTNQESITDAADKVISTFDKIDILVNNGGISQRSIATETPIEVDRTVLETNFFGAVSLTKKVLPVMVKNNGGHILVISSVVGKFGFPLRTAYSASKHALQGFFESLRAETKDKNIRVTIVSPGRIRTNISINAINKDGDQHGEMDPGQANGMAADKCARQIIKAVAKNKKELLIGGKEVVMVYIRKFFPALFYRMTSKVSPK